VTHGEFEVVGRREYRGWLTGQVFEDRLDRPSTKRAVARGDLRFVRTVEPQLQSGSYRLPTGWVSKQGKE
jgi:hypothetical protein